MHSTHHINSHTFRSHFCLQEIQIFKTIIHIFMAPLHSQTYFWQTKHRGCDQVFVLISSNLIVSPDVNKNKGVADTVPLMAHRQLTLYSIVLLVYSSVPLSIPSCFFPVSVYDDYEQYDKNKQSNRQADYYSKFCRIRCIYKVNISHIQDLWVWGSTSFGRFGSPRPSLGLFDKY